jgi:alpha-beta hydrolase superfamily lysophospholipase
MWQSKDGTKLFEKVWSPKGEIKAALCLVHGMGEHCERYAHVADFLNQNGVAVVTFDHRGHGKSEGKRGHSPNYDTLLDDVGMALDKTTELFPNVPTFLFGHSMGGNVVLNYALRRKPNVKGIIASAPWLRLAFAPSKIDLTLAKLMINIYPSFTQSTKLDATAISRDAKEVEKYVKDTLVHDLISPAFFLGAFDAGNYALEHASEMAYSLLIYHGTKDRLTSYEGSKEFASKVNPQLVTWRSWEGLFHEMHNEPEKAEVMQMLLEWIKERC